MPRTLHHTQRLSRPCTQQGLFDLLFAETYGIAVIKPSMQEAAAWLALWDENVAREVARREPWLLLSAGDPATLSRQMREALLTQAVGRIVAGERIPLLDHGHQTAHGGDEGITSASMQLLSGVQPFLLRVRSRENSPNFRFRKYRRSRGQVSAI
jgi:hypothetical protein